MKVILIRHAQSANNALPNSERVCDPDLTELGYQQSENLAESLRLSGLDRIYCSGFLRSLRTAEKVAGFHACPVIVRRDIHELGGCYSGWEPNRKVGQAGLKRPQLIEMFPGWEIDPLIDENGWWAGKPFEALEDGRLRAQETVSWLATEVNDSSAKQIALVIHADFKRLMLEHLFGQKLMHQVGPLVNTGITQLDLRDGVWTFDSLNAWSHLHESLVSA